MKDKGIVINVAGAGLSGMSASIELAKKGLHVRLISLQVSERAQSNLAEGGINAALDNMGEDDSPLLHYEDTLKAGLYLADPDMVKGMTDAAPELVMELTKMGMPFHRQDGRIVQRAFGGQRKMRTLYAGSITGKALTQTLINETRKYEAMGLIKRYSNHKVLKPVIRDNKILGLQVRDIYTDDEFILTGPVIVCTGGMNGFFPGLTTGTTANTGSFDAALFASGVEFSNLEFIQYHPTTVSGPGKRLLVTEAARGEGGRLFCYVNQDKHYFMEEKFGDKGNLMPRDVISKTISLLGEQAYLDMTHLPAEKWDYKLSELREEIMHYLNIDIAQEPVCVSPGIHFFMGGIRVDRYHRASKKYLYAAGECACAYHGANRLGGNSLLGAVYGGRIAADTLADDITKINEVDFKAQMTPSSYKEISADEAGANEKISEILINSMRILRNEEILSDICPNEKVPESELSERVLFAKAVIKSALERKESRGAHVRTDYPDMEEGFGKPSVAAIKDKDVDISFQ